MNDEKSAEPKEPSQVVAKEEKPEEENTIAIPTPEPQVVSTTPETETKEITTSPENRKDVPISDLHQEALKKNEELNKDFKENTSISKEGSDSLNRMDLIRKLLKENNELRLRIDRLTKLIPYDDPEKLQKALDPNKKLNPIEEVQKTLAQQESDRQKKFAQEVEEARIKHDPLYKKDSEAAVLPEDNKKDSEAAVLPEDNKKPEDLARKERNNKRLAMVAGIVTGGAVGLAGGAAVIPTALVVTGIGGLGSLGLNKYADWKEGRIDRRLKIETNPEERTRLEKTKQDMQKIRKYSDRARQFFIGGGIGLAAAGLFTNFFWGGQGAIEHFSSQATTIDPTSTVASASPADTIQSQPTTTTVDTTTPNIDTTTTASAEAINTDTSVLVRNGHVDLPGSAWNQNLAGHSTGNLPGGAENFSNYTGGWHEMAPRMLENDLIQNGLSRPQLLEKLGTEGTHRLLNAYLSQIQAGTANPDLITTLQGMNTQGAQELIQIINS